MVIITGSSRIRRNLDSVPSIMSIMEAERESKKCRGSSQPSFFFLVGQSRVNERWCEKKQQEEIKKMEDQNTSGEGDGMLEDKATNQC